MPADAATILIDCERMKNPFTGLYHFCHHLTHALLSQTTDLDFAFYVPENVAANFAGHTIVKQKFYNKFFFPVSRQYSLWHSTYQLSPYMPYRKQLPVVLTIHDLNFLYDHQKHEAKKKYYAQLLQKNINRASHIVCISESTLQDVRTHLHTGNKPVSIIYNGCSVHEIDQLNMPAYQPVGEFLFTIGTIMEKKNFHVLPALLRDNQYQLIIAGIVHNKSYKEKIVREAEKWGVSDRLIFAGAVSENDKQWYYKHCTAFLFPSVSEGFGLPVVEAMYFGKPVLLSKFTSLPEIGGTAAYYFESFDANDMQQMLVESLADYTLHNRAAAIKQRASFFSWQKAAEKYIEVYKSVVSR